MYLRVVVSQRARVAAVQQVVVTATKSADGWLIRESPRAGVYDAPLLKRMQKLVAILPAYDLLHVDFGEIAHAPPGFHAGEWKGLFGGEPSIANYLFLSTADDDDHHELRGHMIDDEIREILRELIKEIGATSARILGEDTPPRTGVPARTLALGGGEYLSVELPTRSPNTDVEAAFERTTRQLRALRRRWEVARLPEIHITPATAEPEQGRVLATIQKYMQGLAGIDRANNAFVLRGPHLVAAARGSGTSKNLRAGNSSRAARSPRRIPTARTARSSIPTRMR